jgi:hypothetical protein
MAIDNIVDGLEQAFGNVGEMLVTALPGIIAAIIILLVGYIVGKLAGGAIKKLIDRAKLNERVVKGTAMKKFLGALNTTFAGLIGGIVSIFFYLVFILVAIDILGIEMLNNFVNAVILYIPNLLAGLLVLIVGLLVIEWMITFIKNASTEFGVKSSGIITTFFRAVFTLVIIVLALDQWKIDTSIIFSFTTPLAWGIAAAIAIAFGFGFKDVAEDWGKKIVKEVSGKTKK